MFKQCFGDMTLRMGNDPSWSRPTAKWKLRYDEIIVYVMTVSATAAAQVKPVAVPKPAPQAQTQHHRRGHRHHGHVTHSGLGMDFEGESSASQLVPHREELDDSSINEDNE
jgi:hypothetical protein